MLENLGLRVIGESPYEVVKANGQVYWILDFSMLHKSDKQVDLREARDRFQQAFAAIWAGELESDGFNRLILGASLSGREVSILRAYARYMRQVGFHLASTILKIHSATIPILHKDWWIFSCVVSIRNTKAEKRAKLRSSNL